MQQNDGIPSRPSLALWVTDISASRAFYTDMLGFVMTDTPLPDDTFAEIVGFGHEPFLLVGPDAGDVTAYLQDEHFVARPGSTLSFACEDPEQQLVEWTARGLSGVQDVRTPFGEHVLVVKDRDENILLFTIRSAERVFEIYAQGPARLQEVLADLSEQDLELTRAPGEWTIRQLVHHIVDGDDLWMHAVKAALARSGCHYRHDWYTPDNHSAQTLDYAGRGIEPALALFQANHEHILQLARHLPGASERFILFAWPGQEEQRLTVLDILYDQALHVDAHCGEILEIRRLHQKVQTSNAK